MAFASRTYPRNVLLFLALLIVAAVLTSSSSLAAAADDSNSTYRRLSGRYCFGSVGGCQDDEVEWLMESGTSRSLLQVPGKISGGALNKNQPAPGKVPKGRPYTDRNCNGPIYKCNNGKYQSS